MKKTLNRELKLFEVAESESFGGKSRVMSSVSFLLGSGGGGGSILFLLRFSAGNSKPGMAGWRLSLEDSKVRRGEVFSSKLPFRRPSPVSSRWGEGFISLPPLWCWWLSAFNGGWTLPSAPSQLADRFRDC